jgi:hypothetical protein
MRIGYSYGGGEGGLEWLGIMIALVARAAGLGRLGRRRRSLQSASPAAVRLGSGAESWSTLRFLAEAGGLMSSQGPVVSCSRQGG